MNDQQFLDLITSAASTTRAGRACITIKRASDGRITSSITRAAKGIIADTRGDDEMMRVLFTDAYNMPSSIAAAIYNSDGARGQLDDIMASHDVAVVFK